MHSNQLHKRTSTALRAKPVSTVLGSSPLSSGSLVKPGASCGRAQGAEQGVGEECEDGEWGARGCGRPVAQHIQADGKCEIAAPTCTAPPTAPGTSSVHTQAQLNSTETSSHQRSLDDLREVLLLRHAAVHVAHAVPADLRG